MQGLVFLEAGVAVAKAALLVGPDADGGAVEKLDGFDALMNGLAVGAGVAVDGAADPAGDAGHGFQAGERVGIGEVDEVVQLGSGVHRNNCV